jgi:hypothetical protein
MQLCTYFSSCGQPDDDHIRLKHVADLNYICAYFELNTWLCLTEFLIHLWLFKNTTGMNCLKHQKLLKSLAIQTIGWRVFVYIKYEINKCFSVCEPIFAHMSPSDSKPFTAPGPSSQLSSVPEPSRMRRTSWHPCVVYAAAIALQGLSLF